MSESVWDENVRLKTKIAELLFRGQASVLERRILKRLVVELEGKLKDERAEMELVRGRSRGDLHTLSELQAQLDRANGELREWHCDTFVGRCPGCPDCQPVGGTMPQTLERNAADDEKGKRHE